jgi:mRNA interferase RelE/StbE
MPKSEDDWDWQFTTAALDQFDALDAHIQDRIVSKLDEIVDSECRHRDSISNPQLPSRGVRVDFL